MLYYQHMSKGKILSVVNQKGGVGKTTTAINLSCYLSQAKQKVLLVDFDPQGNATSGVGIKTEAVSVGVYEYLMEQAKIQEVLLPTPFENLHVLPSTQNLAGAEVELVDIVSRETCLKKQLDPLKEYYDYIVIDCPPSLGLLTVNALCASDRAIIPLQCEYFALEGIAGLVKTLTTIKDHFNPELEIGGIVLTMFDGRTTLNRQVVENAKSFFEGLMFETVIPRSIRLSESPSHGLPIAMYSPVSQGALAYKNLVKEVVARV